MSTLYRSFAFLVVLLSIGLAQSAHAGISFSIGVGPDVQVSTEEEVVVVQRHSRPRRRLIVVEQDDFESYRCVDSNFYGAFPVNGGCNFYGCWPSGGSCNFYGCSSQGECTFDSCPNKIPSFQCER